MNKQQRAAPASASVIGVICLMVMCSIGFVAGMGFFFWIVPKIFGLGRWLWDAARIAGWF